MMVNKRTIELLEHRVDALAKSFCERPSMGDAKEEIRRKELER